MFFLFIKKEPESLQLFHFVVNFLDLLVKNLFFLHLPVVKDLVLLDEDAVVAFYQTLEIWTKFDAIWADEIDDVDETTIEMVDVLEQIDVAGVLQEHLCQERRQALLQVL